MGEQVKPTEEVVRVYYATEGGQMHAYDRPCSPEDGYVDGEDFARVSAALASARAEVEALNKECERLRGIIENYDPDDARRPYLRPLPPQREPTADDVLNDILSTPPRAAREPGRSGA